jgi:hypothetical protein
VRADRTLARHERCEDSPTLFHPQVNGNATSFTADFRFALTPRITKFAVSSRIKRVHLDYCFAIYVSVTLSAAGTLPNPPRVGRLVGNLSITVPLKTLEKSANRFLVSEGAVKLKFCAARTWAEPATGFPPRVFRRDLTGRPIRSARGVSRQRPCK